MVKRCESVLWFMFEWIRYWLIFYIFKEKIELNKCVKCKNVIKVIEIGK